MHFGFPDSRFVERWKTIKPLILWGLWLRERPLLAQLWRLKRRSVSLEFPLRDKRDRTSTSTRTTIQPTRSLYLCLNFSLSFLSFSLSLSLSLNTSIFCIPNIYTNNEHALMHRSSHSAGQPNMCTSAQKPSP